MNLFIIGSGLFAVYSLCYGIKGLLGTKEPAKEIVVVEETKAKKVKYIDVEYKEL